jgi:excisionase family DNA binding protein
MKTGVLPTTPAEAKAGRFFDAWSWFPTSLRLLRLFCMLSAMAPLTITSPNLHDSQLARTSSHQLAQLKSHELSFELNGETITLPASALLILQRALAEIAQGHAVALTALETQLTTQQAADLIGVSRPYLIKQLEAGELAFSLVGSHRRIALEAVLAFKLQLDQARESALRQLVEQAQELRMGYGKDDPVLLPSPDGSRPRQRSKA